MKVKVTALSNRLWEISLIAALIGISNLSRGYTTSE